MNFTNRWLGLAVAATLFMAPTFALAKHGADDTIPEGPEVETETEGVEKPGYMAKHGADDTIPEGPESEDESEGPEKPGIA